MVESSPTEFMAGGESPPVARRFLKLLIPGFQAALKLPASFSRSLNYTDLNSKRALLKSSRGSWTVDVKKCDHGCLHFLGNTWELYVSEHNLKEGDFIVFKHKGHLHFNTFMFNETGCEKDFAFSEEEEGTTSEDDDVEQMSKSQFQLTLARWNFTHNSLTVPMSFARSNDMMRDTTVKLQDGNGDSWQVRFVVTNIERVNRPWERRVSLSTVAEFMRDNDLKVGDTCIFKLVQLPSTRREHVVMDVAFVRGREKGFDTSVEQDEESSSEDDVECFDEKDEELDITDEDDVPIEGKHASSNQNCACASRFQITIAEWTIRRGCVNVPKVFAISNDMMQNTTVKLRNGAGDSWLAKLQVRNAIEADRSPRKRVMFTGLVKFVRENKLEIGDKCTFELAQPSRSSQDLQHVVMDVVFERRRQYSNCENDFAVSEEEESTSEDDVNECSGEHVEQMSKSQFQLTLTRWNFTHHSLYVPMSFARSNDMMRDTTVKLQDAGGDSWQVRLIVSNIVRANGACEQRVYFSTVTEFMRNNDLKVGDTCIFKLVQQPSTRQEHIVMDVAFVRGP